MATGASWAATIRRRCRSTSGGSMTSALWLMAALLALATPAWAQQTIRIGATPAVTFVVLYAAEHLGYFKAEGLAAQFADFEGGAEVTTAMVGGSIDFAGTYVERPMIWAEKGFGSKNLLAILNRNPIFLVLRKSLAATNVNGLKWRCLDRSGRLPYSRPTLFLRRNIASLERSASCAGSTPLGSLATPT